MAQRKQRNQAPERRRCGSADFAALYGRAGLLAKHFQARSRRGAAWVAMGFMVLAIAAAGCASAPPIPAPEGVEKMAAPELLYQAAYSVYETRAIPIEVASERFLIITSQVQPVEGDLQKRIVTQVVRAAPGAMNLTVTTQWETQVEIDSKKVWQPVDTPSLRARGNAEERIILREIEQRFKSWSDARAADSN